MSFKFMQARNFAFQTVLKKKEKLNSVSGNLRKTKLANGTLVVSLENCSPISKFGAYIEAGARFETSDNLGITHILRNCTGLTTKNYSTFGITRNLDYLGGDLTSSTTRENMIYNMQNIRDKNSDVINYFLDTLFNPVLNHWEISDNLYRVKVDLERYIIDPFLQLIEGLHKVTFRNGLSNSLYCPTFNVESFKRENLFDYMKKHYLTNNSTFVGLGVDHNEFLNLIEKNINFDSGSVLKAKKNHFISGNSRIDFKSNLVFASCVCEGASLSNRKDFLTSKVFSTLLGNEVRVPYGLGGGLLANALSKVAKNPFRISSLNVNYTDTGLFGFTIICSPNEINEFIKISINTIREATKNLNDEQLKNAKESYLSNFRIQAEDQNYLIDYLGNNSKFIGDDDIFEEKIIDSITVQDVKELVKKILKSKCSISSVGKLDDVPYAEDVLKM